MNEDQYKALCNTCDHLLRAPDSSVERVATPWLHVIRAHPIFLENYADIFGPSHRVALKRRTRNLGSMLRHLAKALTNGGAPWSSVGDLPAKCDVLLISHLVNETFPTQKGDFYFGKAAGELADLGINAVLALINYTEASPSTLASKWRKARIPRVIFAPVLGFATELNLHLRARVAAGRLKRVAACLAGDLERRVTSGAAIEVGSGGTVSALRLGEQIKALVARLQPRAIVVTYEGHSWERIAFAAARKVSPEIRCIGYQHAALFNLQHAVQRRLADEYNPDVILTSGRVSQAKLQQNPDLLGVSIQSLGSNRSVARHPARSWRTADREKQACLVLPEGILSECNLLFVFALACAHLMPDTSFIWRLHPNMNYAALIQQNRAFRDLPSNIILSTHTLDEDIARSHWALYRGSTAIVQAAVSGVRPVYVHQAGEIPIDTLYEIAELHEQVVKPEDFKKLAAETGDSGIAVSPVQDYCEQMFTPMDTGVLAACIRGSR